MDRRKFIQQTAAAVMGPAGARAAIARVRTGMLGTGHSHFAGKLQVLLDSPDYEIAGIAPENAAARARLQKEPRFSALPIKTEDELLGDASIHLIVVECHVWEALAQGKKAIDANKHLHLEKPPGNEWIPFKALVEEARTKNLLLQTGYLFRWHQGMMAAIEAAQKGWLGEVFMVKGTMNADRGPEERATEGHYRGGGMFELSGHLLDRIVELLGRPKAVKSWLRHDTSVPDTLADNCLAVLEYDKALAVVSVADKMPGAGEHRSFEILGTDGSVVLHPESNPPSMRVHLRKAQGPYRAGWQNVPVPPQPRFVKDFAELARALQSGQPLKHSYDHELLLHETLLRASGELA